MSIQPGDRFEKLIALKEYRAGSGAAWSCWCECGALLLRVRAFDLISGIRYSCGCYHKPKGPKRKRIDFLEVAA